MSQQSSNNGFVPPSPAELDQILDAYEFITMLGQGGMGAVYQARQKSLDRLVAIKILPAALAADEDASDGFRFAERFQWEARAMARLSHPNIISVFDFGQSADGQCYFVMEYVEGADLHSIIRAGGLTIDHVSGWMSQICDALQYAHARGIVHRDIKPANIMITLEGQVKIADFGLAKLTGAGDIDTKLTMTHMAMGTPDYVAPEALESGLEVDHRADLFALGVMLYELLTGKVPRGAWKPPSTLIEGLDPRYDLIVERAMEADREARFQNASEISATFYEIATTPPVVSAPPRATEPDPPQTSSPRTTRPVPAKAERGAGAWLGIAGALVVLLGTGWLFLRKDPVEVPSQSVVAAPAPVGVPVPAETSAVAPVPPTLSVENRRPEPPASVSERAPVAKVPAPAPVVTDTAVSAGPLFSGVTFPRDLGNPDSPGWKIEEGRIVIDENHGPYPAFVVPVVAGVNHEFEMEYSSFEDGSGNAYIKINTPVPGGWISVQIDRGGVQLFFADRRLMHSGPGILSPEKRRFRMICSESNGAVRTRLLLDDMQIFDEAGHAIGQVLNWINLSQEFITIGGETKGDSRFSIHGIRVTPGGGQIPDPAMSRAGSPAAAKMAPLAPVQPADPRLIQLELGFKARLEKDAEVPHRSALEALNRSYLSNALARARAADQTRGDLDEVTALDAEKVQIESTGALPPDATLDAALPESLQSLRRTYRDAVAKLEAKRAISSRPVYDLYLGALDAYVAELTRSNEIERAREVRAFREQVASRKPDEGTPPVATPTSGPSMAPAAANSVDPAAEPVRRSVREIAESALGLGASLVFAENGQGVKVEKVEDLPEGNLELIEFWLDRLNSPRKPLKADDFALFIGLDDLQWAWVRPQLSKLPDEAFRFLAGNERLRHLNLEGVESVTDGVLDHLREPRDVQYLAIQYAPGFTGEGLLDHPVAKTIREAEFLGSGITDEGLTAIAACPELFRVRITSAKVTDRGLVVLKGLLKLQSLSLDQTAFGDDAAAAISGLPDLRELVISRTAITGRGLARFAELKGLTKLDLSQTRVSEDEVDKLREALPDCLITFTPPVQ